MNEGVTLQCHSWSDNIYGGQTACLPWRLDLLRTTLSSESQNNWKLQMGLYLFCIQEKALIIWLCAATPQHLSFYWSPTLGHCKATSPSQPHLASCVPDKTAEGNHSSCALMQSELVLLVSSWFLCLDRNVFYSFCTRWSVTAGGTVFNRWLVLEMW